MRILLTGAAGRIGSLISARLTDRYDWLLTDCKTPVTTHGLLFVQADIADIEQIRPLCENIDTVIHLAAIPYDSTWETLLPSNLIGVHNIFQAALEANCKRVIFASSIQAVDGYPKEMQIQEDIPVAPSTLYGATKVWGEAVASFYAQQKQLSAICLRLGWVLPNQSAHLVPSNPRLNRVLTHEDLLRLIIACIEAPDQVRFGVFNGLSNNRHQRLDISHTCAVLNYAPQDDAFAIAQRNYLGIARGYASRAKRMLLSLT